MRRALLTILALILAVVVLGLGSAFLALSWNRPTPESRTLPALGDGAEIRYDENDVPHVYASTEEDVFAAMGYLHGSERPWMLSLWRRAALGRLSEWFGDATLDADRGALSLSIGARADAVFSALPDRHRLLLSAYAEGVSSALGERRIQLLDEFAILDAVPEPWRPWHTLAVERLVAWLASSAQPAAENSDSVLVRVAAIGDLLRVRDWEESLVWMRSNPDLGIQNEVGFRYVEGTSAWSMLEPIGLHWGNRSVVGLVIPGAAILPFGRTAGSAWALLPASKSQISTIESTSVSTIAHHAIRIDQAGNEVAYSLETLDGMPALTRRDADSTGFRVLSWRGHEAGSDWVSWLALLNDSATSFTLFEPLGVRFESRGEAAGVDGAPSLFGSAETIYPSGNGRVVTRSSRGAQLAYRLEMLSSAPEASFVARDVYSLDASVEARRLLTFLDRDVADALVREAGTYLENWDYKYDHASIGATIFDSWMAHLGTDWPSISADSTAATASVTSALARSVDELRGLFGDDLSTWRWEDTRPGYRYFPAVSDFDHTQGPSVSGGHLMPVRLGHEGHVSTFAWQPSMTDSLAATQVAYGFFADASGGPPEMQILGPRVRLRGFMKRYMQDAIGAWMTLSVETSDEPQWPRVVTLRPDD